MASLHFFRHLMFVTDLLDLSPIISITFFFSVVIVPSEDLPRRRVEAYTRSWGGCQEIFFHFFNLGCLTAPQVMNTAPSRRIRNPFHFLPGCLTAPLVMNTAPSRRIRNPFYFLPGCLTVPPGYEYGAFQAHKEPFLFFTWMPDSPPGYEYGAFQARTKK